MSDRDLAELPDATLSQLAALELDAARPLIICDADEVLFAFMAGFERFLETQALWFHWGSYAINGNVRRRADDAAVTPEEVRRLLQAFFVEHTELLAPVPGAPEALAALARRAQIVILSNVPLGQREARLRALHANAMPYPLVANQGGKGPAVRALARRVDAPVIFIDDIPHQLSSVRDAVTDAFCLHFVGDPRLAVLLERAACCDHRADSWAEALPVLEQRLASLGY